MKNWTKVSKPSYMDVAYSSERSVEDELDRESHSDISTIAISYLVMFIYIVFSLGRGKIVLSFFAIVLIVVSVFCSVGFFSLISIPLSLIVLEVITNIICHCYYNITLIYIIIINLSNFNLNRLYLSLLLLLELTIYS